MTADTVALYSGLLLIDVTETYSCIYRFNSLTIEQINNEISKCENKYHTKNINCYKQLSEKQTKEELIKLEKEKLKKLLEDEIIVTENHLKELKEELSERFS